ERRSWRILSIARRVYFRRHSVRKRRPSLVGPSEFLRDELYYSDKICPNGRRQTAVWRYSLLSSRLGRKGCDIHWRKWCASLVARRPAEPVAQNYIRIYALCAIESSDEHSGEVRHD